MVIHQTGNRWGLSGFFGWLTATRQGVHRPVEQEPSAEMASPTESHFWLAAQIASELFQLQLFLLAEIPSCLPVTLIFSWITIKKILEDMQRGVAWKVSHFVLLFGFKDLLQGAKGTISTETTISLQEWETATDPAWGRDFSDCPLGQS